MINFSLRSLKSSLLAILVMTLSLAAWSLAIKITDFAPIFLLPLGVILYRSVYRLQLETWQAHYELIVKKDSVIYNLLNGKVRAHLSALVFTLASIPVVAWFFMTAPLPLFAFLCAVIATTCVLFFSIKQNLQTHFNEPFATKYAVHFATLVGAAVSFLLLWWYAWAIDLHNAEFQSVDLFGAVELGRSSIPNPNSIFATLLTIPFVLEALKLWAVVQLQTYSNLALILSLEAALIGFLIAKLGVIVTYFVNQILWDDLSDE